MAAKFSGGKFRKEVGLPEVATLFAAGGAGTLALGTHGLRKAFLFNDKALFAGEVDGKV